MQIIFTNLWPILCFLNYLTWPFTNLIIIPWQWSYLHCKRNTYYDIGTIKRCPNFNPITIILRLSYPVKWLNYVNLHDLCFFNTKEWNNLKKRNLGQPCNWAQWWYKEIKKKTTLILKAWCLTRRHWALHKCLMLLL